MTEKPKNKNKLHENYLIIYKSEKDAIKIITKRLNHIDPHVINHTLSVIYIHINSYIFK